MDLKTRKRLAKLIAMLGSDNASERENARRRLDEILRKHKRSWSELPGLLRAVEGDKPNVDDDLGQPLSDVSALDLLVHLLREYLDLREHEYLVVALWIAHTHVFGKFMVSPRLALVSPVRGCGKTTALSLLSILCSKAVKTDGITPAAIFRLVDNEHSTLLCDEVDNLGLKFNPALRAVLNSGHRRGGAITRFVDGGIRQFSTYAPMALAAIGTLPLPTIHRSHVIRMSRADGTRRLKRFDEADTVDLHTAYRQVYIWSKNAGLNIDPEMPVGFRNRAADNARPLISIADAFGPDWGRRAREAMVTMSGGFHDEDPGVTLLSDIQQIFDVQGIDRISSVGLVESLLAMDDGPWSEWRGVHDDRQPRRLTQGELAKILSPFGIRPRSIWPLGRTPQSKSYKGYLRADFERAWRSYCQSDGTPEQPSKLKALRSA